MKKKIIITGGIFFILLIGLLGKRFAYSVYLKMRGRKTTEMVYKQLSHTAELRIKSQFDQINMEYPPQKITLIGLKDERRLEVWAQDEKQNVFVKSYDFTKFSGKLGPKLEEGDGQIPEGLYGIEYLNPNSRFHLSMKVSYPNTFDKEQGKRDGRTELGSDIMIHGGADTIGCIPIGDEYIEELFILVYRTGIENVNVILAPNDLRSSPVKLTDNKLPWLPMKYSRIKTAIDQFIRKD